MTTQEFFFMENVDICLDPKLLHPKVEQLEFLYSQPS
jgi:hypothetical protein